MPNPCTAIGPKSENLNFHPLEVVSRYRDSQLQVCKNYASLFNLRPNVCKSWSLNHFLVGLCRTTVVFRLGRCLVVYHRSDVASAAMRSNCSSHQKVNIFCKTQWRHSVKITLCNTPSPILHYVKRSDVNRWKQGYITTLPHTSLY